MTLDEFITTPVFSIFAAPLRDTIYSLTKVQ